MSYVIEITDSLTRVLERAATLPDHRVAGFGANAAFWLNEVRHCFEALDGYDVRFRQMRDATKEYVAVHPLDPDRQDAADTRTTRNTKDSELRTAREKLTAAAQKFFNRCHEVQVLPPHLLPTIAELLHLELTK